MNLNGNLEDIEAELEPGYLLILRTKRSGRGRGWVDHLTFKFAVPWPLAMDSILEE
ncbi:hypothetical protein E4U28_001190 [Claviceps purpurea]|nr:hypothetical protein E4U28_001190 [Claviceps purpurea]